MDNKRKLILILASILVVVLGVGAGFAIYVTSGSGMNKYQKKVSVAEKYVQEENWEDAIVAYKEAIEYNETDEEAYYMLASIYIYLGQMDDAKEILELGIQTTESARLRELFDQYFNTSENVNNFNSTDSKEEESQLAFNTSLLKQIASYSHEKYENKYGFAQSSHTSGQCHVKYKNLAGATFTYYNTDENIAVVDKNNGEPYGEAMPWEVTFDSVSSIISGAEEVVHYEDLSALGAKSLQKKFNNSKNSYVVSFEIEKCNIMMECDEDGNVLLDAWNRIEPKNSNTVVAEQNMHIAGKVVSATTGDVIGSVIIYVRDEGKKTGEVLYDTKTDRNGMYEIELPEGNYTAEMRCEGYITDYQDFTIDKWGNSDLEQIVMSEELSAGEIRIVLEWSEYPSDLDSHLEGSNTNDRNIHISYSNKSEQGVELDVDDTNGYGPETITISDINGEYVYYVHDFTGSGNMNSSDATVKVYIGNNAPIVYEVPTDLDGNYWYVCRIENGSVSDY